MLKTFTLFNQSLNDLSIEKTLICTLNAHCYNIAQNDFIYRDALLNSDVLLPDGISIIWAVKLLTGQKLRKIAGADLFYYELDRLNRNKGKCFFLGSAETTLQKIKDRIGKEYPGITVESYSPPFKKEFNEEDNKTMIDIINTFRPDVLMVGMTAPKQEKWASQNFNKLKANHICCIGAVFDFYAGTIMRAPQWMINMGLEWLYRLIREPKRMWKRYLIGNVKFTGYILREKLKNKLF